MIKRYCDACKSEITGQYVVLSMEEKEDTPSMANNGNHKFPIQDVCISYFNKVKKLLRGEKC